MRTRCVLYQIAFAAVLIWMIIGSKTERPVYACMGEQFNSVHFYSETTDFGLPPRRGFVSWRGEHDDRPTTTESYDFFGERIGVELSRDKDEAITEAHIKELTKLQRLSSLQIQHGSWKEAGDTFRHMAKITGWTGSLIDRIQVLREEAPIGADAVHIQEYMHALAQDDAGNHSQAFETLSDLGCYKYGNHLIEHCWYQLAAIAYERQQTQEAIHIFQKLLNNYPQTSKRQAALLMLARCYLLPANRVSAHIDEELARIPSDADIKNGRIYLDKLIASHPPQRYNKAIAGLQARIDFIRRRLDKASREYMALGDTGSVEEVLYVIAKSPHIGSFTAGKYDFSNLRPWLMSQYLLHMANANSYVQYARALANIDKCKSAMSIQEANQFNALLHSHEEIVAPYLYYRLYHVNNTPATLKSIAKLADSIVSIDNHMPQIMTIRIAEIHNMSGQSHQAYAWANKALDQGDNDRALYVRGAASGKMKHYRQAIHDFQAILNNYPKSQLIRGAREELAILYEQKGEMEKALDQYYALGYQMDVAYLLDAKMTKPQIRDYYESHTDTPQRWQIAYALGIRHLRDTNWNDAIRWFKRIPKATYLKLCKHDDYDFDEKPSPDKITAARDLARLEDNIDNAKSRNAKAAAMYAFASYYYKHGTLLLYNNDLWYGERAFHFDYYWCKKQPTAKDDRIILQYMAQHEIYARCLDICRKIAAKYGDTPVAPQAIYRAACSASRLANFNGWWREDTKSNRLYNEAVHWMHQLYTHYPKHPLAAHARKYANVFAQAGKSGY